LNLLSRGLTLLSIICIDAVEKEEDEDADLFECPIYDERGWLEALVFGKTNGLKVNSENTCSIRWMYFRMPLMTTSDC
jgi:hypothetical protein